MPLTIEDAPFCSRTVGAALSAQGEITSLTWQKMHEVNQGARTKVREL